ncbi:hypothetical protein BDY24DRAFT_437551 [Mrakia frigida]|uniref:uncharacterized protein n=1 Tax=Mrakia frigida TaxID=29902 RepID=UPI003FCBF585
MKLSTTAFLPLAAVAFLASFTSASSETSSLEPRTGHFKWSWGGCDLEKGGPSVTPSYPSDWKPRGLSCGSGYYYHSSKKFCVPRNDPGTASPSSSCTSGKSWDSSNKCCKNKCAGTEFYFAGKDICLPIKVPTTVPSCPSGKTCPSEWQYNSKGYCVPKTSTFSPTPSCSIGSCDKNTFLCNTSPCKSTEFWFAAKKVCIPNTVPSYPPSCPSGKVCPTNWIYQKAGFCAPKSSTTPPTPSCSSGSCDSDTFLCSSCKSTEFWWDSGKGFKGCIPKGGPPSGSPPSGSNCITKSGNRKWHSGYKCCVPTLPDLPTVPTCSSGHWTPGSQCCTPGPVASGTITHPRRRSHKQIVVSLPLDGRIDPARCPKNLTACPLGTLGGADYECLDPEVELTSCGGCASTGAGENCLLIPNSLSVTCTSGSCAVLSCRTGLAPSLDGKSCI